MRRQHRMPVSTWAVVATIWAAAFTGLHAQQTPLTSTVLTPVPRLMWFSGAFRPADRLPVAAVESVTVTVYRDQEGGDALWQETHQVSMAADGRYSLLMGSTLPDGLPLEVFTSGEPRWIGITVNRPGEVEQPRVHLTSVAYALKAADADTLGGHPASAYLLADPALAPATSSASPHAPGDTPTPASSGTAGYLGRFVDSANLGNSVLVQSGSSIGLGTAAPHDAFHVAVDDGTGTLTGYAVQNLSGAPGAYSGMLFYDQNGALGQFQGFNNATHEYRINNVGSGGSINFRIAGNSKFQVANNGNIGIGITNPAFKLAVVDAANTGLRVQTNAAGGTVASFGDNGAFQIDALGIPGGRLTVRENGNIGIGLTNSTFKLAVVAATTGLRVQAAYFGGTVASFGENGDFHIDAFGIPGGRLTVRENGNVGIGVPAPASRLDVAGDINLTGTLKMAGNPVLRTSFSLGNTGLGHDALRDNTTGSYNTATGYSALQLNTGGHQNTGVGYAALRNTNGIGSTGAFNTAVGYAALWNNTTGNSNIAIGGNAGTNNTTGNDNSFFGRDTGLSNMGQHNNTFVGSYSDGAAGITNATAVGFRAQVTQSHSLVLGSINLQNGATADTNVGIGTTAPKARLHVAGGPIYIAQPSSLIITSPNGNCWFITVNDSGALGSFQVPCPEEEEQ